MKDKKDETSSQAGPPEPPATWDKDVEVKLKEDEPAPRTGEMDNIKMEIGVKLDELEARHYHARKIPHFVPIDTPPHGPDMRLLMCYAGPQAMHKSEGVGVCSVCYDQRTEQLSAQEAAAARASEAVEQHIRDNDNLRQKYRRAMATGDNLATLAAQRQELLVGSRQEADRLAKELGNANAEVDRLRILHNGEQVKRRRITDELQHTRAKLAQLRVLKDPRGQYEALQREAQRLTDTLEALGGDVTWTPEQAADRLAAYEDGRDLLRAAVKQATKLDKQLTIEQRLNETLTTRAAHLGAQLSTVRGWMAEHAHGPIGYLVSQLSDALFWTDDKPIPFRVVREGEPTWNLYFKGRPLHEYEADLTAEQAAEQAAREVTVRVEVPLDEVVEVATDPGPVFESALRSAVDELQARVDAEPPTDFDTALDELAAEATAAVETLGLKTMSLLDRLVPTLKEVDRE